VPERTRRTAVTTDVTQFVRGMPMSPVSESKAPHNGRRRPRFHFTPPKNWMNDPNGLVWYGGTFHLFYQYNPFGTRWGNMHWGHAESADLVGWRHLPVALFPDRLGTVFSGSVVVDRDNTSGLFGAGEEGLVAVFTHFKWGLQRQGVAASTDGGLTWGMYRGNPVIKNPLLIHFRDPKVFYHAPGGRWVMLVTVGDRIRFYLSEDLLSWTPVGHFGAGAGAHGGVWECPDLFELAVDGDEKNKRWVLLVSVKGGAPGGGSGTQYFVGDFDGRRFVAEGPAATRVRWLDYGADNYAGITYNNVPEKDGRRIFIGWMSDWRYAEKTPTAPWRGAMTTPRELVLLERCGTTTLAIRPVGELAAARTGGFRMDARQIEGEVPVRKPELAGGAFEIAAQWEVEVGGAPQFGIVLANGRGDEVVITFEPAAGIMSLDRRRSGDTGFSRHFPAVHRAPVDLGEGRFMARVLVDTCSVEVFAGDGTAVITDLVFPETPYDRFTLFSRGGAAMLRSLSGWGIDPHR
jgi:fructan beta-fructosidase